MLWRWLPVWLQLLTKGGGHPSPFCLREQEDWCAGREQKYTVLSVDGLCCRSGRAVVVVVVMVGVVVLFRD